MYEGLTKRVLQDIQTIAEAQCEATVEGAILWKNLGRRHLDLIERYGFENFKRTINFEYGQASVASLHHPFVRKLLKNIVGSGHVPTGFVPQVDLKDMSDIVWPVLDDVNGIRLSVRNLRRLLCYASYCGLLWQFAEIEDKLDSLALPEPLLGHPMPIWSRGRLISQDLALASLDMNRILSIVPLKRVRRVMEIGAGYGRFAYAFHSLFPDVEYWIVDISPALAISQNYLASVFGGQSVSCYSKNIESGKKINFILPHQISLFPNGHFDLVLNMSSFDEMPSETSIGYLNEIDRICAGFLYLNGFPRTSGLGSSRLGLEELPYNSDWKIIFSAAHRVHAHFVEKIFQLR